MHNAIANQPQPVPRLTLATIACPAPPPNSPSVYTKHDVIWYGIFIWAVWVSCPAWLCLFLGSMHQQPPHRKLLDLV